MTTPVYFTSEAAEEVRAAVEFLDAQHIGLGDTFVAVIEDAVERLSAFPEIGSSAEFANLSRRWKLPRFPYSLIYVFSESSLVVVAVAHDRREPGYWRSRRG